jgi:tartrate dehydrogenase/decarboxylase / D-malate dehydrogenase
MESKQEAARIKAMKEELEWVRQNAKGRQAKSKARLQRFEELSSYEYQKRNETQEIFIPVAERLGNEVIEFIDVSKGYGDRLLIDKLSMKIPPGAIVGIIGPNGAGKSTLFRMITGKEQPDAGEIKIGPTVKLAFVDQSRDALQNDKSVWEAVSGGLDMLQVGSFEMPSARLHRPLQLQGRRPAEDRRPALRRRARPAASGQDAAQAGGNVLLLDEPSNDLDVETLRALEEALLEFAGTVLVISHDRWFLDRICTHILAAKATRSGSSSPATTASTRTTRRSASARRRRAAPHPLQAAQVAAGDPHIPDHVTLWGLRLKICQGFDQYANVRPTRILPGIDSPLKRCQPGDLDWVIVRENSEGEYSGVGGRVHQGHPIEAATDVSIMTRVGVERVLRYAFALARSRPRKLLTVVTKSNAQRHAMVMWDEIAAEVAREFPDVSWDKELVDAATARMVNRPASLDTIVATNLHADILSDLAAALAGSLGIAPTGNIDPERRYPSMFEPIHGSAFDIMGKGLANPIGTFWSCVMLLEHLGEASAARRLMDAIEATTADPTLHTRDLGGQATTAQVTQAVCDQLAGRPRG